MPTTDKRADHTILRMSSLMSRKPRHKEPHATAAKLRSNDRPILPIVPNGWPSCKKGRTNRGLEHDPEKLADFSDKIMRPSKEKHDPEKSAGYSDKIMRPDKEEHDPEKSAGYSDKIMGQKEKWSAIGSP